MENPGGLSKNDKRKNYSLKFKYDVACRVDPGVEGKGFVALAKELQISRQTVKNWFRDKEKLKLAITNPDILTRTRRRLPGAGRRTPFDSLDQALMEWVHEQNDKGFVVKDKYVQAKALAIRDELLQEADVEDNRELQDFKASTGKIIFADKNVKAFDYMKIKKDRINHINYHKLRFQKDFPIS